MDTPGEPKGTRVNGSGEKDGEAQNATETRDGPAKKDEGGVEDGGDSSSSSSSSSKKSIMSKLGLDMPTLILMFKGSLPPTIAIAIYQATPVASYFSNLGYLMAVITVISLAILPRGKFVQTMAINVVAVCVGAAVLMLILWSSIQARIQTTPAAPAPAAGAAAAPRYSYNSSQSAVCAVWLFFNIWLINFVRAKLPAFNIPMVIYSILVNVGATEGPLLTTTAAAEAFVRELLTVILCGFGLATAVSLFVIPISGRTVTFGQFKAGLGLMRACIAAQRKYLVGLESHDMFRLETKTGEENGGGADQEEAEKSTEPEYAAALQALVEKLRELGGKMHADLPYAKRDIAWGKLDAKALSEVFSIVRSVYIPLLGMSTVVDIFRRAAERRGWAAGKGPPDDYAAAERERERHIWNQVIKQMHGPFASLADAMDQGLEHVGLALELTPRPKTKEGGRPSPTSPSEGASAAAPQTDGEVDVEAQGDRGPQPGDAGFGAVVKAKVQDFATKKGEVLRVWQRERRLATEEERRIGPVPTAAENRDQAQLYILLYLEKLMLAAGEAVSDAAAFADKKIEDGTMKRNRLIVPSERRLRRWLLALFRDEDEVGQQAPDVLDTRVTVVYLGDGYSKKKDPEHLPPANAWEHAGDALRKLSHLLSSEESMFGLKCAFATMTIGIVAFLQSTQLFFVEQRLVWAMIMVALGMTPTAGQSIFGFLMRLTGTLVAMICAFIIWYIVDQKTAGVIVFLWLFTFAEYYVFIKFPRLIPAAIISMITQVLIIGYELQVRKIGEAVATSTGQPYYPTYELAPYRLATVAGGMFVAFIWTVFPQPITDRTWLRRDLSASLYLLANYFTVVNESITAQLKETGGDVNTPDTPAYRLRKAGRKIFGKLILLLPSLRSHAEWQKWEPTVGGRFPSDVYAEIIRRTGSLIDYLTLMAYALSWKRAPEDSPASATDRAWLNALADVIAGISPMQHTVLSTLTLLSNALLSGHSLPPFLPLPKPYDLTRQILQQSHSGTGDKEPGPPAEAAGTSDRTNILDPANMEQPGYTEFAVLQVCGTLLAADLEALVHAVSGLVGVVDFSFRVDMSASSTVTPDTASASGADAPADGGSELRKREISKASGSDEPVRTAE